MKKVLFFLFQTFLASANAQVTDSIYSLNAVEVNADQIKHFSSGLKIVKLDSTVIDKNSFLNLSDLLQNETSVFIKSYGQGSLATISLRGTASTHTGIFWNGISLNSPNLGLSDIALIPVNSIDNIEVQYGGGSSFSGSGNLGGSIHLTNSPEFKKKTSGFVAGTIGSFGLRSINSGVVLSNEKVFSNTTFIKKQVKNDFHYFNTAQFNSPLEKLQHAELDQLSFLQDLSFSLNEKDFISANVWYTQSNRNLPPSMTTAFSNANQKDETLRAVVNLNKKVKGYLFLINAGNVSEQLVFTDTLVGINSKNKTNWSTGNVSVQKNIGKFFKAEAGYSLMHNIADIESYQTVQTLTQQSYYAGVSYFIFYLRTKVDVKTRKEFVRPYNNPWAPSLGFTTEILKWLSTKGNISRVYRVPTLNDRFWFPGGNSELKPETGWSKEAGVVIRKDKNKNSISLESTIYSSTIKNWIIWEPQAYYWSPQNKLMIWSRGYEINLQKIYYLNQIRCRTSTSYNYTVSTSEKKESENDATFQKQLPYVPYHTANTSSQFQFRKVTLSYNHSLVGGRFILSDNSHFLTYYHIGNGSLAINHEYRNLPVSIQFNCFNIFNRSYQAIEWRAMPLRNYALTVMVGIK